MNLKEFKDKSLYKNLFIKYINFFLNIFIFILKKKISMIFYLFIIFCIKRENFKDIGNFFNEGLNRLIIFECVIIIVLI